MGLSKKTFLYSLAIALVLTGFVVVYFAFMLPSLFVEHEDEMNLESIANTQEVYMEKRSYDGVEVRNPTGCFTVEIPKEGNTFYVAGKAFRGSVEVKDPEMGRLLDEIKGYFSGEMDLDELEEPDFDVEMLQEKLVPKGMGSEDYPLNVSVDFIETGDGGMDFRNSESKYHSMPNDVGVFEFTAWDDVNAYTTYLAMGKTSDAVILSILPVVAPQMDGIQGIVAGSLPMIFAVLFLLVLIFSQYFSRRIVNPVIRLAGYAEMVKTSVNLELEPLVIREKDEIGELGRTLNELYGTLRENYLELERKNAALAKENERQEVFVRASSHQLKTPIAAAMLLVDGMIHEVGKYKDTKMYLPQVKEQLNSMRKMVEEMLYLSKSIGEAEDELVDPEGLVEEVMREYQVQVETKELAVTYVGNRAPFETKRDILKKVLENVISNAIYYTPVGGEIRIIYEQNRLVIQNYGVWIDEEMKEHLFEPFVGSMAKGSHGLGLYICGYCAKLLECELRVENAEDGVEAVLLFGEN